MARIFSIIAGLFFLVGRFSGACEVHALKALENPALLPEASASKAKTSPSLARLAKEFSLTLASICSGQLCGVDPKVDQSSRDQINEWLKKAEKLSATDQALLKTAIRDWIRLEIHYLLKNGYEKQQVEMRSSKIRFFDARFAERKSPFKDLFCLK